jgi:hypothetical protein
VTLQVRTVGVLMLALVVLGAAARPFHGELTVSQALAVLGIVVPATLLPAFLVRYAVARRWLAFTFLAAVLCAAVGLAVTILGSAVPLGKIKPRGTNGTGAGSGQGQGPKIPPHTRTSSGHVALSGTTIAVLVAVFAAVVVAAVIFALRRQPPPAPVAPLRKLVEAPTEEEVARRFYSLLDDTLDDLRAEPDPRRAVIAAYARMEHGLGTLGVERERSETPFEYLARVLERVSVSEPSARTLTDLFERAKFGRDAIGPELKEQAVAALESIKDEARAWVA